MSCGTIVLRSGGPGIEGRMKYLENRVAYATISVRLEEPEPLSGTGTFSPVSVINEGIAGFFAVSAVLVIVIISLLPLVALAGAGWVIFRWWKGKSGGRGKKPGERGGAGQDACRGETGERPPGP